MKIESTGSAGIYNSTDATKVDKTKDQKAEQNKQENTIVFAGNLNIPTDSVAEKKKEAQKMAMGIISDAYAKEKEVTDNLSDRRNRVESLKQERSEASDELATIEAEKESLKETYGVTEDSQEYKDLLLLERQQKDESLTQEEKSRLQEINVQGMTEYQKKALEYNEFGAPFREIIADAKEEMVNETKTIRELKKGLLKSHAMVDATNQADQVLEQMSGEIIGMLINESKDHIQEELEEKVEEVTEKVEEKKKQEAKLEEAKAESSKADTTKAEASKTESLTGTIASGQTSRNHLQEEMKDMLDKMKLVEEDLKGIVVDTEL